ncbi:NAD(P)-dependent oxidoreductase [Candidatus Saccharibacteria bacterium]|nr:NAD(P)-dependent oxidoreductase [Candidatus Saccharibacteria bacterium]
MDSSKFLILGVNGQLGRALSVLYPQAQKTDIDELDITSFQSVNNYNWDNITTILNAAAYTNVDGAETEEGQASAWAVNDKAVASLADIAKVKNLLLVHISTEYVFDGTKGPHKEDEPPSPLGVYAKTKTAGDKAAAKAPKHYIVRTSWVIGDGKNFARTMLELGKQGVAPTVVADQIGRPTFTTELAKAIKFLIDKKAPYGTYNVTNEGEPVSWADFTRAIFKEAGLDLNVTDTTTEKYFAAKPGVAPRPLNSVLDLSKIESAGFSPRDWREDLKDYIRKELKK